MSYFAKVAQALHSARAAQSGYWRTMPNRQHPDMPTVLDGEGFYVTSPPVLLGQQLLAAANEGRALTEEGYNALMFYLSTLQDRARDNVTGKDVKSNAALVLSRLREQLSSSDMERLERDITAYRQRT